LANDIDVKEIEMLIKKLELDREILAEQAAEKDDSGKTPYKVI
jgi:hypothetical protein